MYTLLMIIYVPVSLALILVVLMQSSKGESLASAFGGSSLTGAVFGGRGAATFLSKATTFLAITFMLLCMALVFVSPTREAQRAQSAVKKEMQKQLPGGQPTTVPGEEPAQSPAGTQSPVPPATQQPGNQTQPQGGN